MALTQKIGHPLATLKMEMRRAGILQAVNFQEHIKQVIARQAPRRWLLRLLAAAKVPPNSLTLGTSRNALSIIAPLFAAATLSRDDLNELFTSGRMEPTTS